MSLTLGIKSIMQGTDEDKPHILGYNTARTSANKLLFDMWNGTSTSARKAAVDLDGKLYSAALTAGDMVYAVTGGVTGVLRLDSLAIGAAGKVLRSNGSIPTWSTATIPDTAAAGDLLYGSATNVWTALAIGGAGKVLRSNGSIPTWTTATIPDTAAQGDLLYGSATNVWTALAKGTESQVLEMNSGATAPAWTSSLGANTALTAVTAATLVATTRLTAPLMGTTTDANAVIDRNSVTKITVGTSNVLFADYIRADYFAGNAITNNTGGTQDDLSFAESLLDVTATTTITGISGGVAGRVIYISTRSGVTVTLKHADAGSTASNQFELPGSTDFVIGAQDGVALIYLNSGSRWKVLGA